MEHIVIIGNGIAGTTAARHIRKMSAAKITIISSESEYFFSRTALMYVYMGHMKFEHTQPFENNFWAKNKLDLLKAKVLKVTTSAQQLELDNGKLLSYDKLIIATGSKTSMYDWSGQDAMGVVGLYSKQDLEQLEALTPTCKAAVVVGGGLIGIELAEMLHSRNIPTTMLVREDSFWNMILPKEESEMVNREIRRHHVNLLLASEMESIEKDEAGNVQALITKNGQRIACNIIGIATGVSPNISFLQGSDIAVDKGILVNEFLESNIENVYAIGDCAQRIEALPDRRNIEAVWYTGRMMGETVALNVVGKRTAYQPGPWFNSAKFFNIEYQTYGVVNAKATDGEAHFYFENERCNQSIRLAYDKADGTFLGINLMGIRMRHEYFHKALLQKQTVEKVVKDIRQANFDPEFYKKLEPAIQAAFNKSYRILTEKSY